MIKKISRFFREVISEVKKVTWPGKKELIASTIAVIILVVCIAFYIGLVDFILSRLIGLVL
ncbi:MAG: preprotein translocase subunit SecE [Elusimicrobia bacterium]|nr:preprotein translocase subunit SecE [Elusimicrobiota bacterium]